MGPELPYNLDEASLFELATEKDCDYCESEKARPYYAWSIRSCNVSSLTLDHHITNEVLIICVYSGMHKVFNRVYLRV